MMKIEKVSYPDSSFYTKLSSVDNFQFRINSYDDLWQLAQIKDKIRE